MELDKGKHSVFSLNYKLILVVKYRNKVINEEISNKLKEIFEHIAPGYNIILKRWWSGKEYVQVKFKAKPSSELVKFINSYKSASSRVIKREYSIIKQALWEESFWTRGYCLLTTLSDENDDSDLANKYIKYNSQS